MTGVHPHRTAWTAATRLNSAIFYAILGFVTSSQAWCYAQDAVERLQGSLVIEHTLARVGAEKLWKLMRSEPFVPALGALTGNQAMQQIRAGLKAVYCSGWQVCCVSVTYIQNDIRALIPIGVSWAGLLCHLMHTIILTSQTCTAGGWRRQRGRPGVP